MTDENIQPEHTTDEHYAMHKDELDYQFALRAVQEARRMAYPTIGDQLDALFKAGVFPPAMAAEIQAVKDANPKPPMKTADNTNV
jgi:hypothetical protein